ncbi:MAG TPA: CoA pyrophosphatase [Bacteroidales bacterium]|nr:CoA pyrophosphatase [Bacteroidales bacterium]HQI69437.1 CoA pyrophosphatase [Bacteroidales bacterium]
MNDIVEFTKFLVGRLQKKLPGKEAHFRMVPSVRLDEFDSIPENARLSSVLILLFEKNAKIHTILIQRPEYNGIHSAQISLPGGGYEEKDLSAQHTALRETQEEIGLDPATINIIGSLTDLYIPPSNYRVKPFVGYCRDISGINPDKHEVKKILTVAIEDFAGTKNVKSKKIKIQNGTTYETSYYDIMGQTVWGATAMIFSEFAELYEEFINRRNLPPAKKHIDTATK